ncbi:MAG: VWA domain-containing protein [Arachnia sp.]
MGQHRAAAFVATLLVALGTLVVGPAAADDGTEQTLLMVLDASGSMKQKLSDGRTRIAAAKASLNRAIDQLPESTRVGMRVYGASVPDEKGKKAQCADSELVVPIGTGNRSALRTAVKEYSPLGETPIAYSLRQAAKDLPESGNRTILLVSDGEETCAPDPCPTAEELAGVDLRIDVIGVDVNAKARRQLTCIADKGNGRYIDARTSKDLDLALSRLAERAFRPFGLSGTPVTGTADVVGAPGIGEGNWVDTAPASGSGGKNYRIRRTIPGSDVWVGLAFTNPPGLTGTQIVGLDVEVSAVGERLTRCDGATASAFGGGGIGSAQGLFSALVTSFERGVEACDTADELAVTVAPNVGADLAGHPIQLRVHEEPPVADEGALPAPADPVWEKMKPGNSSAAPSPGSTFDDAPSLAPGTFRIEVVPGEIAVYQVPVGWGQRLQVQLDSPGFEGDDGHRIGTRTADLGLIGPYGGDAGVPEVGPGGTTRLVIRQEGSVGVSTRAIAYRNRSAPLGALDAHADAVAGNVRVVVNVVREPQDPETIPWAIPLTMTIKVIGDESGQPIYLLPTAPSPTPTADTSTPAPTTSAVTTPEPTPPSVPAPPSSGVPWLALGLGGGLFVAAAALVWVFRKRRVR